MNIDDKGSITIKQTGSMAGDAHATFTIDRVKKEVVTVMFTARGNPFVSSRALETLALRILPEHNVIAFNTDSPKSLTDWRLFVDLAGQRLEAQIVKQSDINGGAVVVELSPAAQDEEAENDEEIRRLSEDVPMTVFIAEPIKGRLIVDACDGDTPEDLAQRQRTVDLITQWKPQP